MSATAVSTGSAPHPLWSGIQDKCFECNRIPQIDVKKIEWRTLDEIRAEKTQEEAHEYLHFFELFLNELQAAGVTGPHIKSLQYKAGEESTDSQKSHIRNYLQILYARWAGKLDKGFGLAPISTQEKHAFVQKIQEGAGNCSAGFLDRMQDLVDGLTAPRTLGEFFCIIRKDYVEQTAVAHSDGEVHSKHRFHHIASFPRDKFGYNIPKPAEDPYSGSVPDSRIRALLQEKFFKDFDFIPLLLAFIEQFKSRLLTLGYIGANPDYVNLLKFPGGVTESFPLGYTNHWQKFQDFFCVLFDTPSPALPALPAIPEPVFMGVGVGAGTGEGVSADDETLQPRKKTKASHDDYDDTDEEDFSRKITQDPRWFIVSEHEELGIELITDINWSYVLQRLVSALINEGYVQINPVDLVALITTSLYTVPEKKPRFAQVSERSMFECAPQHLTTFFSQYQEQIISLARKFPPIREAIRRSFSQEGSHFNSFVTQNSSEEKSLSFFDFLASIYPSETLRTLINRQSTQYHSLLITVCKLGKIELAKKLIALGGDINLLTLGNNDSALLWAIDKKHWDLASFLLKHPDLNPPTTINSSQFTPLMLAAVAQNVPIEIIDLLLERGAGAEEVINLRNENHQSALSFALKNYRLDIIQRLRDKGALFKTPQEGFEAELMKPLEEQDQGLLSVHLSDAATHLSPTSFFTGEQHSLNKLNFFSQRLGETLDLHIRGEHNITLLMSASTLGQTEVVKKLIALGANPNHLDDRNESALAKAIRDQKWETALFLLGHASKDLLMVKATGNLTTLLLAASFKEVPIGLIQALLEKCPEAINELGDHDDDSYDYSYYGNISACIYAIRNKRFDLAVLLIMNGDELYDSRYISEALTHEFSKPHAEQSDEYLTRLLNMNAEASFDYFTLAIKQKNLHTIGYLIEKFPEQINARRGSHHTTAFIEACKIGCTEVALNLIDSDADINLTDDFNDSGLSWAIDQGQWDTVLALLAHPKFKDCAHLNKANTNSHTPLSIAANNKKTPLSVIKALLTAGAVLSINHIHKPSDSFALTFAFNNQRFDIYKTLVMSGAEIPNIHQIISAIEHESSKSLEEQDPEYLEVLAKKMKEKNEWALRISIAQKHWPLVLSLLQDEYFFKAKNQINQVDNDGHTLLTMAINLPGIPLTIIEALLEKEEFRVIDYSSAKTPNALQLAISHQRFDIARCLVIKGAAVTLEQARLLCQKELENPQKDRTGIYLDKLNQIEDFRLPYFLGAINRNDTEAFESALGRFTDTAISNHLIIQETAKLGRTSMMQRLLTLNPAFQENSLLLSIAICAKQWETAESLLEAFPTQATRVRASNGNTPLIIAATLGKETSLPFVQKLLSAGALSQINNRTIPDDDGLSFSALDKAMKSKNPELIELLVRNGAFLPKRKAIEILAIEEAAKPARVISPDYLARLKQAAGLSTATGAGAPAGP
jgi:ankyrin repeat protein